MFDLNESASTKKVLLSIPGRIVADPSFLATDGSIKKVNLSGNQLGSLIRSIAVALQTNVTLSTLVLSSMSIVFLVLQKDTKMGPKEVDALAECLKANSTIRFLNLGGLTHLLHSY